MTITGLVHVNINCSNCDRSLSFYELLGFEKVIDLLEWQDPSDKSPPYPHLYLLGIARIALATADLDSDIEFLESRGVEFLSEPATVKLNNSPVTRFVCFKDPDGTVLELVERH